MATDPRKLKPVEACRLLNSTPLGEVINERQLHRHRVRAGLRIGDEKHVDLVRYTAWLAHHRHEPKPPKEDPYGALKERARARNAAISLAGRNIGEMVNDWRYLLIDTILEEGDCFRRERLRQG